MSIDITSSVILKMKQICQKIPQLITLAIVGSSTRDFVSKPNDIDFLAITISPLPNELLISIIQDIDNIPSVWNKIDDTFRGTIDKISVGIAFLDKKSFEDRINALVSGYEITVTYLNWTISGNAPEVLCSDIVNAIILLEEEHYLSKWKERLFKYPDSLRSSILSACGYELHLKTSIATQALILGDEIMFQCTFYSALFPLLRGLFAMERTYFSGMKYISRQIQAFLPNKFKLLSELTDVSYLSSLQRVELLKNFSDTFSNEK